MFRHPHSIATGVLPRFARQAILVVWFAGAVVSPVRGELPADSGTKVDFGRQVRPILADKCFACHGPDEKSREADLRLDERPAGDKATVIVAGEPERSELVRRITTEADDKRMPPRESGKTLSPQEVELLRRWIREGANYAAHWSYASLVAPSLPATVPTTSVPTARNFVDAFLNARLARERLQAAPEASRHTLVRRAAWDLLGLPLDFDDALAWEEDSAPDAHERLVDRLLASPRFGERMAIYWLDLVRYADTVGYHGDQDHHASPYRDYVIDAFNANLPFDRFTAEQLAGDLLPSPTPEQVVASCYNRLLQTSHEGGVQAKEYLAIYAADRVRNLSGTWLGATIGCAQCHDHKFDPITSREFYELSAFFADVDEERHLRGDGGDTVPTRRAPELGFLDPIERQWIERLEAKLTSLAASEQPEAMRERQSLEKQIAEAKKRERRVMVTQSLATPRVARVLPRGNWLDESGAIVSPNVPRALGTISLASSTSSADSPTRATRLDLAKWLTDARHGAGGLTARVFANRTWYLFFGAGLSKSLDDLGAQGSPPENAELLEALASSFVASEWDVKRLVRAIVTSQAYRRSSSGAQSTMEKDLENRFFARQNSWRLPAESLRDTALANCGLLNRSMRGAPVKPYQPAGYYQHLNFPKREYVADKTPNQWRRGVYMHWQRQFLHPMLRAFDAPSREECTAQRPRSNTPLAALVLLNDPTFVECARELATLTLQQPLREESERIAFAFSQVTGRCPSETEREVIGKFLQECVANYRDDDDAAKKLLAIGSSGVNGDFDRKQLAAWTATCRLLFNLSEAVTRE